MLPLSVSLCFTRSLTLPAGAECDVWWYMASLSHGLLSFYEEKLWGIYVFCLFFPLSPLFFYAFGHRDLVQQMSPDVLFLKCVTGVLGIYIFCVCFAVFNARHREYEFLNTFHCWFPLHSSIVDMMALHLTRGRMWGGDEACLLRLGKQGSSYFSPLFLKCSFLFSSV